MMSYTRTAALLALAGWWAAASPALAASADIIDMEPDLAAKVNREKLKQKRQQNEMNAGNKVRDKESCGKIDIGNNDAPKRGAAAIAQRETTVVVTGNVINATNCR
ncbi:MAG TPA: hypothetical protein VEC01_19505 [Noviherbaspirillum sp.]|uniref:hypothetical protein n=1 Tax=Noviherbaspirillum sp. TaxID=1926288 RepID=UPI002D5510F2|nr:hypothetical protein [Noviherbaspirillum sp.]HYD97517.1 hypothetical protein [Noviherbaspirillum sp.]